MPQKQFWLIGYAELVWDRTVQGFVPKSVLLGKQGSTIDSDTLNRFKFDSEEEVDSQMTELQVMGCSHLQKKGYGSDVN